MMPLLRRLASAAVLSLLGILSFAQNTVILDDSLVVTVSSSLKMKVEETVRIMVLNKDGEDDAAFMKTLASGWSLKSFSGRLVDPMGKVVAKYGLKDVRSTQFSEGLADDYTTKYLVFSSDRFPYVVEYSYEENCTQGFLVPPPFAPVRLYEQEMKRASYTLVTPSDYGVSWSSFNCAITPQTIEGNGCVSRKWVMPGFSSISDGIFMPLPEDLFPMVCFSPDRFSWFKREGSLRTIDEYGRWKWNLIEESSEIPAELAATVHAIADPVVNKRDKILALYGYMQKNYRYVSIQIGIGGQKPMSPGEVYRNKFGDCKALSNLMKCMLREAGIESCYVEISTSRRRQPRDIVYPGFMDHAILKIPDADGDLWVECTSSKLPLGYIHQGLAGHDAFVYQDGTMHIETVPDYSEDENMSAGNIRIEVKEDGSATIVSEYSYSGLTFERMFPFGSLDAAGKREVLRDITGLPSSEFQDVRYDVLADGRNSSISIKFSSTIPKYTSKSGNRELIPLFPGAVRTGKTAFPAGRTVPYMVYAGNSRTDDISVVLPSSMRFETLPEDISVSNRAGSCLMECKVTGEKALHIHLARNILKGDFSSEDYPELETVIRFYDSLARVKLSVVPR